MAKSDSWIKEYIEMINDCEERDSRLTDWERGFLDSIRHYLELNTAISERQFTTLENIWERVTR